MRNPNCTRCFLSAAASHVCLWGNGSKQADIMFIGEAPGETEDELGLPFQGRSGKLLDDCIRKTGLRRKDVYVTNAVKCRPPENRDPSESELGKCFPYLAQEIEAVNPKVIICVGRWALKAVTGEGSLARARGRILTALPKIRVGNAKIVATYHPASYLYSHRESVLDSIVEDIKNVQRLIGLRGQRSSSNTLLVSYTAKELKTALGKLDAAHELSCDLEWTAVAGQKISWPWTPGATVLSIALAGRVNGEVKAIALSWPKTAKAFKVLKDFIEARILFGHNFQSDLIWLLAKGIKLKPSGCTMLLAYLLDEERRAGLKGLAPLLAGVDAGWEKPPLFQPPESDEDWHTLLTYNATDAGNTYWLNRSLDEAVGTLDEPRRSNIRRVYQKLLVKCLLPFAQLALTGAPISRRQLDAEIVSHREKRSAAVAQLAELAGLRPDRAEKLASSPKQVTMYAREAFGLDVDGSNEEALGDYTKQYPPLGAIKDIKYESHSLSTWLEPWSRLIARQGFNRLHSVYGLDRTKTGRLSADIEEGGSLLLTPRAGWARGLIKADKGWEIHVADYSQAELRMIAWLAPEPTMRALYEEGADLHTATAAFVKGFGKRWHTLDEFWPKRHRYMAKVTKEERQRAKAINFGFCFGMQAEKFVIYVRQNYGVEMTLDEALRGRAGYFSLYSALDAWHDRCKRDFYAGEPTITPFGRYRFSLGGVPEQINTPIQSTASDLTIFSLVVIAERLEKAVGRDAFEMVGFVHDCILVHAKKGVNDTVREIIRDTMEQPPLQRVGIDTLPVPLVADVKTGKTWAAAS